MALLDLVYNPVSGSFRKRRLEAIAKALEDEGFQVRLLPTEAEGVRLPQDADCVCVHGGDGTLRDVVQALGSRASDVPLCIAPSGTINLVATELGYARKAAVFARELKEAWERGPETWVSAPLYKLGDMPIVACVSIGPDSHAVARVSDALKKRIGRYAYVVALLDQMRDWPRDTMTVRGELDNGSRFECEAQAAIASHGAFFAGPFRLSRRAALHADSVELVTVARSTRIGTVLLSLFAILGLPVGKLSGVEVRSVKRVEFDRCVTPVQVDGDHIPDCAYAIAPSGMTLRYVV